MDGIRTFSRRALARIIFYLLLLGALIFSGLFFGMGYITIPYPELALTADQLMQIKKHLLLYVLPGIAVIFLLMALALWAGIRGSAKILLASPESPTRKKTDQKTAASTEDKAEKRRHDKQMYLYLLSLLQREGRLLDFFAEDLTLYEDAQIGAAVRGIHENCKKIIDKNLSPKPIIDRDEGENITVAPGFDPAAYKLVGNVSGEPPFTGVLRHRGWQTKKEELPTLSGTRDASILAPAEVEIQ